MDRELDRRDFIEVGAAASFESMTGRGWDDASYDEREWHRRTAEIVLDATLPVPCEVCKGWREPEIVCSACEGRGIQPGTTSVLDDLIQQQQEAPRGS